MRVGDEVIFSVVDLANAAEHPLTDSSTRALAVRALEHFFRGGETLMGGAVGRDHLLRLYRRRLKRKAEIPSFPQGTEEFVLRMTAEEAVDPIVLFVREAEDGAVFFFCDTTLSWLVGCVLSLREPAQ